MSDLVFSPSLAAQLPRQATASARQLADEGRALTREDAERLENELKSSPDDPATRTRLLGYYFARSLRLSGPAVTLGARRRHILWLIQNRPDAEIGQWSEATIDPSGHSLADKEGYEQAKALWRKQIDAHRSDTAVLRNAVKFFTLPDKELAEDALTRAQAADPTNRSWTVELGYLYALGVMGINGLNQNGFPTSVSPSEVTGGFAKKARSVLEASNDAAQLATAGRFLSQYGVMIRGMGMTREDHTVLAEALLKKAQALAPHPQLDEDLKQLYEFRRLLQGKAS